VLDVQYEWGKYYKPYMRPIAGHTNTPTDPVAVRAFRVSRDPNGIVTVKWKPKAEIGEWRGADNQVGTPGFEILKGLPKGAPIVVEPLANVMEEKYYKQLIGSRMRECVEATNAPGAMDWLKEAALHGAIPVDRRLQESGCITPGALGPEVELRCDDVTAVVQLIDSETVAEEEFWDLPQDIVEELNRISRRTKALSEKHQRHPAVGYKAVSVRMRPTYSGSAAAAKDMEEESKQVDSSEEDSEEEPLVNNASRMTVQDGQRGSAREAEEKEEPECQVHEVVVIFGQTDQKPDMWLGVKLPCKSKGKVRVQFMQAVDGECGMYFLCHGSDLYRPDQIEHTFNNVQFINERSGKDISTRTLSPLDPTILDELSMACAAFIN
jgi:hypothetical protein